MATSLLVAIACARRNQRLPFRTALPLLASSERAGDHPEFSLGQPASRRARHAAGVGGYSRTRPLVARARFTIHWTLGGLARRLARGPRGGEPTVPGSRSASHAARAA